MSSGNYRFAFIRALVWAACCSEGGMPLLPVLLKGTGRYGKTASERFHRPEMLLESKGGSGRVVGEPEVNRLAPGFRVPCES
jgi:hypothetical protein